MFTFVASVSRRLFDTCCDPAVQFSQYSVTEVTLYASVVFVTSMRAEVLPSGYFSYNSIHRMDCTDEQNWVVNWIVLLF